MGHPPNLASEKLGPGCVRKQPPNDRRTFVLLGIAGLAVLAGSARFAVWRSEIRDRSDYELATRLCLTDGEEERGSAAAAFWCGRARRLSVQLGGPAAELADAESIPGLPGSGPESAVTFGATARELVRARTAVMWGRLDGG